MKKPYTKPSMAFQNMLLATGVAAGCAFSNNATYDTCETLIGEWGETIVTEDRCDWSYEKYPCYEVPAENSNIFQS